MTPGPSPERGPDPVGGHEPVPGPNLAGDRRGVSVSAEGETQAASRLVSRTSRVIPSVWTSQVLKALSAAGFQPGAEKTVTRTQWERRREKGAAA